MFHPFLRKFVVIFFDDILIYSTDLDSHLSHLQQIFLTIRKHSLFVNYNKCTFATNTIEFLGHLVTPQGVRPHPDKISSILNWPTPSTIKQLRSFLGLSGYYRRFIKNYAMIASPLTNLLVTDCFVWTDKDTQAFKFLQNIITTAPILALPDFTKPFILETDASGCGIEAVLSQNNHPIAFFSKKLSSKEQGK